MIGAPGPKMNATGFKINIKNRMGEQNENKSGK
jgi:hypothetical protein